MLQLPFVLAAALFFFLLLLFLFVLVQVHIVTIAFSKLGLSAGQTFLVLMATLIGSAVNLPAYRTRRLVRMPSPAETMARRGVFFRQMAPTTDVQEMREQIVAVNVGGCVIPCLLSLHFIGQVGLTPGLLAALAVVTVASFLLAKPIPGVGIGIPVLIPPIITALAAAIFAPPGATAHVAYVSGSLGTLLGADILHLLNPRTKPLLDAPVLSIGGAGTFDGIFITGILAVLLA